MVRKPASLLFIVLLVFDPAFISGDQKNITAKHGETVLLPCQASSNDTGAVEWTRVNKCVYLFRDGHLVTRDQHPSFVNRTCLADRQMEGGNLSLILEHVSIEDSGTYECFVTDSEGNRSKAASILLNVTGADKSAMWWGVGLFVGGLIIVVGLLIYKYKGRCMNPKPGHDDPDGRMSHVCDHITTCNCFRDALHCGFKKQLI